MMRTLSPEEQISRLRSTVDPHTHMLLLVVTALGFIAANILQSPALFWIAVYLAFIGLKELAVGLHILSAIMAYDTDAATEGEVSIAITPWEAGDYYHATVRAAGHSDWKYEFIPEGWCPNSRSYPAKIWRTGPKGRPVLAVVEEGILIPRYDPKPVGKRD